MRMHPTIQVLGGNVQRPTSVARQIPTGVTAIRVMSVQHGHRLQPVRTLNATRPTMMPPAKKQKAMISQMTPQTDSP